MHDLRRLNVRIVRQALEGAAAFAPFPRASDRAAVAELRQRIGTAALEDLLAAARADREAPMPALPARLYADFRLTGRREPFEEAVGQRRQMLYRLVLAEYLEASGAFMPAAEELLWARLEETNWAWPAHAPTLDPPDRPSLDLAAAMTALDMAEIDHLLGDALDPALRARLRHEVERRVIGPFLVRSDHWWLNATPDRPVNNWTAVCVAGAVGAALYLEPDADRLAAIIARGLSSLADYLETFDPEGGSTEGPDYWSYGFGNFVVLAHLLAERTAGRIDLLANDFVREIARFPLRTVLAPGLWVSFSDSDPTPQFNPALLTYLAGKLELPELRQLGVDNSFDVEGFNQFAWPLRQYHWLLPPESGVFSGASHDWYQGMAWMVARLAPEDPYSLRLAVKGGHNEEMHNQNDVGSLIVVSGGRVLLTDPGRGRYSKAYFGPERYDNIMASSFGHSVPVVNGFPQAAGRQHAATVLGHASGPEADSLELEFAAAYPEAADLAMLNRRVTLERTVPSGRILIVDRFRFRERPGRFETVLVTTAPKVEIKDNRVVVRDVDAAIEVSCATAGVRIFLDRRPGVEKQYAPAVDLTRIVFCAPERLEGSLDLQVSPRAP